MVGMLRSARHPRIALGNCPPPLVLPCAGADDDYAIDEHSTFAAGLGEVEVPTVDWAAMSPEEIVSVLS